MRALCTFDTADDSWDEEQRRQYLDVIGEYPSNLEVGATYTVYGVVFKKGLVWYLVQLETDDHWVVPRCSLFFELVDATVPDGWELALDHLNAGGPALLPPEWARDPAALEKLADGSPAHVETFQKMRRERG